MTWLKAAGALLAAGLLAYGGHWCYERGRAEVLADWTASQLAAEQAARTLETTWQGRVATARIQADEKLRAVSDSASANAAYLGRLRSAAAAKLEACENTAATKGTRGPGDLLTDVLSRAATRAGELAAYADRERIAREECQAAWPK
jgi:hypothetical protein